MGTRLPIFPLGAVLVPGLVLPLHIFEPRYRLLIEALMALPEGATRQFGVVALRSGYDESCDTVEGLYSVGCTAELREVTPFDDGRFDVVTVGETRFELRGFDDDAGTPYRTGLVDFLPEIDGDGDIGLLTSRVVRHFADYRSRLGVEVTELPDDSRVVSYLVAAAVVMDLDERQDLLAQPTISHRLRREAEMLKREKALLKAFRALPAVDLTRGAVTPN